MSREVLETLLRQLLLMAGAYLIRRGWVEGDVFGPFVDAAVPAIVTAGIMAWGMWKRRRASLIATVAALPEVQAVIAPPVAADIPAANVVATPAEAANLPLRAGT